MNRDQLAQNILLTWAACNDKKLGLISVKDAFDLADLAVKEAKNRVDTARPAVLGGDWISVDDRLPEKDTDVLTCDAKEELWIDVHPFSRRTTHWQTLPALPFLRSDKNA